VVKANSEAEILKVKLSYLEAQEGKYVDMERQYTQKTHECVTLQAHLDTATIELQQSKSDFDQTNVDHQLSKVRVAELENEIDSVKSNQKEIDKAYQSNLMELERIRGQKEKLEVDGEELQRLRTELALEAERRSNLEKQLEALEEDQLAAFSSPTGGGPTGSIGSIGGIGGGSMGPVPVPVASIGGVHEMFSPRAKDNLSVGGSEDMSFEIMSNASMEQAQLHQLMSRISSTNETLKREQQEFERLLSEGHLESITE